GRAGRRAGEFFLLEILVLDVDLLQVEILQLAAGFDLFAASARGVRPRGLPLAGESLEVELELIGREGLGLAGFGLAEGLAVPAAPAATATATAFGARARPLVFGPDTLVLLAELGGPGFDLGLEQRFDLVVRPFRLGGEDLGAEGRLARLQPLAAGD